MTLAPIAPADRLPVMDVLRGFALLGILLMNIEGMAGPLNLSMTGLDPSLRGADRWVDAGIYLLVQGKFYTLFSLLFGMGFAVMMTRAEASGRPFVRLYLRRSMALLAIGLLHGALIWSGDILASYALLSLLLLFGFRRTRTSRLPWWGLGLYAVPVALMLGIGLASLLLRFDAAAAAEAGRAAAAGAREFDAAAAAQRLAYGQGDYAADVAQRLDDLKSMGTFIPFFGWMVLGLFVLGVWFVRSGAISRPEEHARLYTVLRWGALPAGAVAMLVSFVLLPTNTPERVDLAFGIANALSMVASLLMSLGYLAWVVHAFSEAPQRLAWLAPAGRMALTNYLMQSLVCTLFFYGYGLGWFEQVSRAWQLPFALALFGLQVLWSRAWLARFRFGPVEWLWRAVTYGRWPAMR